MNKKHVGSTLDSFLEEVGQLEEVRALTQTKIQPKQVLVWRNDLKVRKGKFAAQIAHASMLWLRDDEDFNEAELIWWRGDKFTKIVCGVESEAELLALVEKAKAAGVRAHVVTDAGATEFHGVPTITCAGFGPDFPEKLDPITGGLKLL